MGNGESHAQNGEFDAGVLGLQLGATGSERVLVISLASSKRV